MNSLHALDYVVIVAYFATMIGIGFWSMRRTKNREDYLVAGGRLSFPMFFGCMAALAVGVSVFLPTGVAGLLLAAALAACMSVSSGTILACSTTVYNDVYLRFVRGVKSFDGGAHEVAHDAEGNVTTSRDVWINRGIALNIGVLTIVLAVAISDIFKALDPRSVSLAGGNPDTAGLPHEEIAAIADRLLRERGAEVLQYGSGAGVRSLEPVIAVLMARQGASVDAPQPDHHDRLPDGHRPGHEAPVRPRRRPPRRGPHLRGRHGRLRCLRGRAPPGPRGR